MNLCHEHEFSEQYSENAVVCVKCRKIKCEPCSVEWEKDSGVCLVCGKRYLPLRVTHEIEKAFLHGTKSDLYKPRKS